MVCRLILIPREVWSGEIRVARQDALVQGNFLGAALPNGFSRVRTRSYKVIICGSAKSFLVGARPDARSNDPPRQTEIATADAVPCRCIPASALHRVAGEKTNLDRTRTGKSAPNYLCSRRDVESAADGSYPGHVGT